MKTVKGTVALVTGANRGIGKSIVEEFLDAGAVKVYAAARNVETLNGLLSQYGDHIVPLHIDLNVPETIQQAADIASDVEIVVNNAGMLNVANPLASNAIDAMTQEVEVNVYGLMRMAQAFAPVLKKNGGGALVQLNSVASMKSFADFATYSASKAASYSITQALRDTLSEQGTHVISVHPGPIATDMAKDAGLDEIAEPAKLVPQAIIAALENDEFHAFPDTIQVGDAYRSYATGVVEANMMEGS
jgi:NAD(P)-dependent dehydrogenase (short-subunit alcohol dehydrogenase family)